MNIRSQQAEFWAAFSFFAKEASLSTDSLLLQNHALLIEKTESTNSSLMKDLTASKEDFLVRRPDGSFALTKEGETFHKRLLACYKQTAGRGRVGRTFYSEAQKGVYFSLSYIPQKEVFLPALYTVASAVGMCRAIRALYNVNAEIKWVNDIFVGGKKVCGILTEGVCRAGKKNIEALVIGIGVNLFLDKTGLEENQQALLQNATGIENEIPCTEGVPLAALSEITRPVFLARAIFEILRILCFEENVIEEYRQYSFLCGKYVTVTPLPGTAAQESGSYTALVRSIADDAGLVIECADGSIKTLYSGEVSLHEADV